MSETDLERALADDDYRESLVSSVAPLARFLRRAGAFYRALYDEIDYTDWNGAIVGRGPGSEIRGAIPPDPSLSFAELSPLLELGRFARELVARHPATPLSVLTTLAEDPDWDVRHAITSREDADSVLAQLSPELVAKIRGTTTVVYEPPTEGELRAKVESSDPELRRSATRARKLPEDLMLALASDPNDDVRRDLAFRSDLTPAALDALLEQEADGRMLATLATNAALPVSAIRRLLPMEPIWRDHEPGWFERRMRSPWPTSNAGVRLLLAKRSGLPADLLAEFAQDTDWRVRAAVAANPESDEPLLETLIDDDVNLVRLELAKNPKFRSLGLLATDPDSLVCSALTRRSDLTLETLELLARDQNAGVRAAIAARKDTPRAVLERLRSDGQAQVRDAATRALAARQEVVDVKVAQVFSSPPTQQGKFLQILEQWGLASAPLLSVIDTLGSANVFVGVGTLSERVRLLVPTHADLLSSLTPKPELPARCMLLISFYRSEAPVVSAVIGGPTSLAAATAEVSPHGNTRVWRDLLDGLPFATIKNRTRWLTEERGSITCSCPPRVTAEDEAAFVAALGRLAEGLGLDETWKRPYAEAGAESGVSVTTQCTARGPCAYLALRFGSASWDQAIDLVGSIRNREETRGAAVRMGALAGALGINQLHNVEVALGAGTSDVEAWFELT